MIRVVVGARAWVGVRIRVRVKIRARVWVRTRFGTPCTHCPPSTSGYQARWR